MLRNPTMSSSPERALGFGFLSGRLSGTMIKVLSDFRWNVDPTMMNSYESLCLDEDDNRDMALKEDWFHYQRSTLRV